VQGRKNRAAVKGRPLGKWKGKYSWLSLEAHKDPQNSPSHLPSTMQQNYFSRLYVVFMRSRNEDDAEYDALTSDDDRHYFILKSEGDASKFKIKDVHVATASLNYFFDYIWLLQGYTLGCNISDCGQYVVWSHHCDPSRLVDQTAYFTAGYKDPKVHKEFSNGTY
jgi:hypothetical protein